MWQNQGNLLLPGTLGNPNSPTDDVVVDGKIITAAAINWRVKPVDD